MPDRRIDVLYEDNHLLVLAKPAGWVTQGAAAGALSLWTWARDYLKRRYAKPGNVYLGIVSRLDAPVTGAVVFARTSKAAGRMSELFRTGRIEKTYWAVVAPAPAAGEAACTDWLVKDERRRRMVVVAPRTPEAREARLSYRTIRRVGGGAFSLLEVSLETGRKHQIRVQLARRGSPVVGDVNYGSTASFSPGIALHARRLAFEHPVRREPLEVTAPLPAAWRRWDADGPL